LGKANQGKGSAIMVFVFLILSIATLGFINNGEISNKLTGIVMTMEEGMEIVSSKSYEICSNVKWSEIKATGVKVTEMGLDGFLQVCERLALDLGNLRIYADVECRLLWIYSETNNSEVYYVQFK
jgi:hypothetical protein